MTPATIVVPLTHRNLIAGGRGGTIEVPVTVPTFVVFTDVGPFAEAWRRNSPAAASAADTGDGGGAVAGSAAHGAPGPVVVRGEADQRPELAEPAPAPQHAEEVAAATATSLTTAG